MLGFLLLVSFLFITVLAFLKAGENIGRRSLEKEGKETGLGAIEGAVFGLMGLLIAFTSSGAANRFDLSRRLIGEEASAMGTAYLRIDLLPPRVHALIFAATLASRSMSSSTLSIHAWA